MANNFANNLKLERKSRGYNRKEMAERLKVEYPTYCNYENGNREPNLDTLIELSNKIDCTVDELIRGTDLKERGD